MATANKGFSAQKPVGKYANWDTQQAYSAITTAIAEIEREANVRMKCYDRWIADGRMTDAEAQQRLDALVAAWHILSDTDLGRKLTLIREAQENS